MSTDLTADADSGRRPRKRSHTGRARNEQVRQAILQATMSILLGPDTGAVTIEAIASAAGVGKQTIYRWWPSKSAVMLEALSESSKDYVRDIDSGDVRRDVDHFLTTTFRVIGSGPVSRGLRTMAAEALADADAAELLRAYTATRRLALHVVLARGQARGELSRDADIDLAVEQAFGVLWYRLLLGQAPLTKPAVRRLATGLLVQLGHRASED